MLIIDNLLLAPLKGIFWIFKEIHKQADEQVQGEAEDLTQALSELYMKLETGQITEQEFEAQESELLDRLEAAWERSGRTDGTEDEDEEEDRPEVDADDRAP